MSDMLTDYESNKEDQMAGEKVMAGEFVKVGDHRAGFAMQGQWNWKAFAKQRYAQERLAMAKAFAEEE